MVQSDYEFLPVAHGNEADTYDGSNSETLAQHIEDKIQAAGTVDKIIMGATCVVKISQTLYKER